MRYSRNTVSALKNVIFGIDRPHLIASVGMGRPIFPIVLVILLLLVIDFWAHSKSFPLLPFVDIRSTIAAHFSLGNTKARERARRRERARFGKRDTP